MGAAAVPLAAIGAIGGLIQGNRAQNQAQAGLNITRQQLGMQQQAFNNQQALYGQAAPAYHSILNALQQNAGIGATPTSQGQLAQNVLGMNATPADLARYQTLSQQLGQVGQQAMHNAQYGMGTRGLYGSSLAASQDAAIQSNLGLGQQALRSQVMDEAQQNYANRLNQLYQALLPGLGANATAAGIAANAGQQGLGLAGQAFGQQGVFGGQLAGALQNYLQYQAMQSYLNPSSGGGANAALGNQAYQNFANAGLGNTQDLGGGYSVTLPDGFNF